MTLCICCGTRRERDQASSSADASAVRNASARAASIRPAKCWQVERLHRAAAVTVFRFTPQSSRTGPNAQDPGDWLNVQIRSKRLLIDRQPSCAYVFPNTPSILTLPETFQTTYCVALESVSLTWRDVNMVHLSCGQRDHAVHRCRTDEAATVQHRATACPVTPKRLGHRADATMEHEDVAAKGFRSRPSWTRDPACLCASQCDGFRSRFFPRSGRASTRDNAVISTPASTITRQTFPTTISMRHASAPWARSSYCRRRWLARHHNRQQRLADVVQHRNTVGARIGKQIKRTLRSRSQTIVPYRLPQRQANRRCRRRSGNEIRQGSRVNHSEQGVAGARCRPQSRSPVGSRRGRSYVLLSTTVVGSRSENIRCGVADSHLETWAREVGFDNPALTTAYRLSAARNGRGRDPSGNRKKDRLSERGH